MILNKQKRQFERGIYYEYADYMFTVCYRYIGNREVAEEMMNNGFLKAFNHYNRFENRGKNSLKIWIKRIMINECLMFLRRKNNFELLQVESLDEHTHMINPDFDSCDQIFSIIKQLPVGYRTVFNLYAIEGYSHAEISKKLNIKESTSRSQMTMARRLLKEYLIKIGYEAVGQ